jgi:uncharacterized metal-binding protein
MSNGNTHELVGVSLGIPSIIIATFYGAPPLPIALGQAFALFMASPDVDTKSNATRRWGVLRPIWSPLQKMTKHRGITHHPFLGPVVVSAYLGLMIIGVVNGFLLALSVGMGKPFQLWLPSQNWAFTGWAMSGVFFQFWVHLILDELSSSLKRAKRR